MGKNYYLKDRDILDQALEHSWGKSADAKAKERAYNREYYQRHKEEILRKARQAGEGIQRTAQNAYNAVRKESSALRRAANGGSSRHLVNPNAEANRGSRFFRNGGTGYFTPTTKGSREGAKQEMGIYSARRDTSKEQYRELMKNPNTRGYANQAYDNYQKSASEYSDSKRKYDTMRKAYMRDAAAENEAAKARRQESAERKFDSKIVRDAQNAYSKLRNPKEMARRAGESTKKTFNNARDTAQNAINDVKTAFSNERRQASNPMDRNAIRSYERANEMNDRLYKEAKNRFSNAENRVQESNARAERFRKASAADPSRATEYQKMAREAGQETYNRLNESNRAYKNQRRMANRRASSGAAYNEASKAEQRDDWGVYDKRFDSKLARDLQNTKAKARGAMSKAEKAAQQAREDAKKRMKKWFNR